MQLQFGASNDLIITWSPSQTSRSLGTWFVVWYRGGGGGGGLGTSLRLWTVCTSGGHLSLLLLRKVRQSVRSH